LSFTVLLYAVVVVDDDVAIVSAAFKKQQLYKEDGESSLKAPSGKVKKTERKVRCFGWSKYCN
jgi:hypothetical protein